MDLFLAFCQIVAATIALKAIFIGSDFNFFYLFKYRRKYWKWYDNREKFNPKRDYPQYAQEVFGKEE